MIGSIHSQAVVYRHEKALVEESGTEKNGRQPERNIIHHVSRVSAVTGAKGRTGREEAVP